MALAQLLLSIEPSPMVPILSTEILPIPAIITKAYGEVPLKHQIL